MGQMYRASVVGFLIGFLVIASSCEKLDTQFDSDRLILKSTEISATIYRQDDNGVNTCDVIPHKIFVKGGTPLAESGHYYFEIAEGSQLPQGLKIDHNKGIIESDGTLPDTKNECQIFEIKVSDGVKTVKESFSLNIKRPNREGKIYQIPFQFSSPQTTLLCGLKTGYYGVSLGVSGGTPPYYFELVGNDKLPGDLTLNPLNGVIAGKLANVKPGQYNFRIKCTDNNNKNAVSLISTQYYEEITLVVK